MVTPRLTRRGNKARRLMAMVLSAILATTNHIEGHSFRACAKTPAIFTTKSGSLGPVALGLRSVVFRRIVPPASAFSGALSSKAPRDVRSVRRNFGVASPTTDGGRHTTWTGQRTHQQYRHRTELPRTHDTRVKSSIATDNAQARGGNLGLRPLLFWESMVCGAVSRSVAQTATHPANTLKTILQSSRNGAAEGAMSLSALSRPKNLRLLTRGAGAQIILSLPTGAINFAILECVRRQMNEVVRRTPLSKAAETNRAINAGLDFLSSAVSTVCTSVVSTPTSMILDNIMAGTYSNLPQAVSRLATERGVGGFYTGWWPGVAGKIPSYGLTWAFFQQLKAAHDKQFGRPPSDFENSVMACLASSASVTIMMPMDTIKTRLVTQAHYPGLVPYRGISDCAVRMIREEGVGALYHGLTPRLVSVVPMIGIQFGVYEYMKRAMLAHQAEGGSRLEPIRVER